MTTAAKTMAMNFSPKYTTVTPEVALAHGLTEAEYKQVRKLLGRTPNLVEVAVIGAMWSEHCSYKSSKRWLKTLPTKAPWVIQGPGENAGVIDIGDGQAAVFKIESHNRPSYIEPYQGAATGVGGILRDVFTMGARPIANMNALRFGDPAHPKTRGLVSGVVSGIGGYGNCVGIPTVGGECQFDASYNGNCLVNAMTVGIARADRIFYARAGGIGSPVVYVGSKTGRDGIHGATMSSAGFEKGNADTKKPTVQVGDPFVEKLLIEACLELMAEDAIIAIQDMGAAGLTSSLSEMASRGGVGVRVNCDLIPAREEGMTAYEFMLSESQERMLMILKPEAEDKARKIFEKWELDFAVIGALVDGKNLTLLEKGEVVCDMPVSILVDDVPEYDLPWVMTPPPAALDLATVPEPKDYAAVLTALMGSPDMCSKRWIWQQYDHMVGGDTNIRPGGDAAVVRVHGTRKAIAISTDCTPRYCLADPVIGGAQAVAESYRNVCATGATPRAVTNNLNFGTPTKPHIMGQIVGCITGMRNACETLDTPVVSGNVSLNNETDGRAIMPTPVIGVVGVMPDVARSMTIALKAAGEDIFVVGATTGELGQSLYLREIERRAEGAPPSLDLAQEKKHGMFVRDLIQDGMITAAHDVSDGGVLCAVADMALAGDIGVRLEPRALNADAPLHAVLFGEDQARYVLTTTRAADIETRARAAGVPLFRLGATTADAHLSADGLFSLPLATLRHAHDSWLPQFMG